MPTAPRSLLLAPLLSACVEIKIDFPCAGEGCPDTGEEPAESGPTSDSGEPTGDTPEPAEELSECEADLSSEPILPTDADCGATPVEDWELVEVWSATLSDGGGTGLAAARSQDVDGDGAITAVDPLQVWATGRGYIELFDADGVSLGSAVQDVEWASGDLADVDPMTIGTELWTTWSISDERAGATLLNGTSPLWSSELEAERGNYPALTDLEGDGAPEALLGDWIVDAATGAHVGWLDGTGLFDPSETSASIAADLDLDGRREIVVASSSDVAQSLSVFESDGSLRATCLEGFDGPEHISYAVGNLDDDPEGEVFVAGNTFQAICDTDGALLLFTETDYGQVGLVGIGQLDEDDEPELLVNRSSGLFALELDLTEKWRVAGDGDWAWYPFALADLDGDGRHEVIVNWDIRLLIVGPDGEPLARGSFGSLRGASWQSQPIVADIDADGLVEIVATGGGVVSLIENASGGWPVRDAATPWHGLNRAPHDRDVAGAIPAPAATWLEEGYNVWQGLPAGTPGRPDLSVSIVEVCGDACDEDLSVVVQAGNTGTVPLFGGAELVLYAASGAELGRTTLDGTLSPGEGRQASFTVPASALDGGLRAEITPTDATDECGRADNTATWTADPCP